MKVIELRAENVKRLKAVAIRPESNVVTIAGKNGAGKSSVLDSIAYALGGKALVPEKPVRNGQEKATITVDLGDLRVTRTFTAEGGGSLKVEGRDGLKYPSPQTVLNKLVGDLSFDPLAFERMKPAEQRVLLGKVLGVDTTELDQKRKAVFERRTEINRQYAALKARLDATPYHEDAPESEIAITDLSAAIDEAAKASQEAERADTAVRDWQRTIERGELAVQETEKRIEALELELQGMRQKLTDQRSKLTQCRAALEQAQVRAGKLRDQVPDTEAVKQRLAEIEETNRKVRENRRHEELKAQVDAAWKEATALTGELAAIDAEKEQRIASARFPVARLGLTDTGVTIDGIPFEQCSTAQKLRVSVAIALALNPKVRVILVREGSLLDSDSMKTLARIAEEQDAQVWVERVADAGDGVSILIEDGTVRS